MTPAYTAHEGGILRARCDAGGLRERATDDGTGHLHAFPFAVVRRPEGRLHATILAARERCAVPGPRHARPLAALPLAPKPRWRRRRIGQRTADEARAVAARSARPALAPACAHFADVQAEPSAIVDSR